VRGDGDLDGGVTRACRCPPGIDTLIRMRALQQDTETVRRMSPAEKLAVMHGLIRQAWELKAAVIRSREPELSEAEVTARAWAMVAGERP